MCGFAGLCDVTGATPPRELAAIAETMAATLKHRGPDGEGSWCDAEAGLALAHRRLAVIHPGPAGAQPMVSASGRYVLAYNGEIYNFPAIKRRLEERGRRFSGHCDTEILLSAIEEWGLEAALTTANGMFAFALWDRRERRLHLARDRMGKKPLYFGRLGKRFVFASELKALREVPGLPLEIDRTALAAYLRERAVPAPLSIFRHIYKLPPGTHLALSLAGDGPPEGPAMLEGLVRYWSAADVALEGLHAPLPSDEVAAAEGLEACLTAAVESRMISDVPLGAFLSGGIDSTLVVALMQRLSSKPVKTFTAGFESPVFDESRAARETARHLGTDHTEFTLTEREARESVPLMARIYDEPFADASQVPSYLISRVIAGDVTVALSGDGGDELFGGYTRYRTGKRLGGWIETLPAAVCRGMSAMLQLGEYGAAAYNGLAARPALRAEKLDRYAALLRAGDFDSLYRDLHAQWRRAEDVVIGAAAPGVPAHGHRQVPDAVPPGIHRMMLIDTLGHLHDDILAKVDRASMASSLEVRSPILDHEVFAYAWRLPLEMKWRRGRGKCILRRVLSRHMPDALFERPKQGFKAPIGDWLRGPLQDWAGELLDPKRLAEEGYLDPAPVARKWRDHLAGRYDWSHALWTVLMFQAWKREVAPSRLTR